MKRFAVDVYGADEFVPAKLRGCHIGGGGSSSSTIDPNIFKLLNSNVTRAQGIANQPFQPYGGQLTADMNSAQQAAGGAYGNLLGADQNLAARGGASALMGFQPQSVSAPMASAATSPYSMFGSPSLSGGANADAGLFSNPAMAQSASATPGMMASPSLAQGANAGAASINRGDVQNVNGGNLLGGISQYQNPFTNDVVNTTLSDIDRSRQMAVNQGSNAANAAHAFGGSRQGVADSLTNEAYGRIGAQTAAGLRSQGFDTAANLAQSDASRALQAGQANQGADLSVAGQNAGYQQQSGLLNANNALQNNQFNAGLLSNANQFNAGNQQQSNLFNAGNQQQAALANAGAQNQAGLFNAGNTQAANLFNAGNQLQNNQFNAGATNSARMADVNNAQSVNLANMGAQNQFGLANQGAQMQGLLANQSAGLQGAGVNLNATGLLGDLNNSAFNNYQNAANSMLGYGNQAQATQQAQLSAMYNEYLRQQGYAPQMQTLLNQSLGLLPAASQQQAPDNTGGILGGIGSLVGGAGLLFSDANLKTDIRTIRHDGKGRRWVTYRYVWDAPGMVRHGVIAQELERIDPRAVSDTLLGKMVDYSLLEAA